MSEAKRPAVSVIVPVYKVEDCLPACAESLLGQTFADFELIFVDDGSPDGCGALCDGYAARDARVKVIHQKNGGLSAARNSGLDIARGEAIAFVDSPCPDHLCEGYGWLSRQDDWAACLPAQATLTIE